MMVSCVKQCGDCVYRSQSIDYNTVERIRRYTFNIGKWFQNQLHRDIVLPEVLVLILLYFISGLLILVLAIQFLVNFGIGNAFEEYLLTVLLSVYVSSK
jgi:hypothetical protein